MSGYNYVSMVILKLLATAANDIILQGNFHCKTLRMI